METEADATAFAPAADSSLHKAAGNLPWVEKYRPASLDQLVSHGDIISTSTPVRAVPLPLPPGPSER
jgi:hypothetical protein